MSDQTTFSSLPPLPSYSLTPRTPIVTGISDQLLQLLLPILAYWVFSLGFHVFDTCNLLSQYRLHTPAELTKRNHVTRYEVIRDVITQQLIQTAFGLLISMSDPIETTGKEAYDIAVWARRIRIAQRNLPRALALLGFDSDKLSTNLLASYPNMAGAFCGGNYSHLDQKMFGPNGHLVVPAFAGWEILLAKVLYHGLVPASQFGIAIFMVDTWQYFLHRAMHMNKWLYTTLHSRHHRLYVPYAFGALYNHPVEGFLLDIFGTGLAYLVTGMSVRQGIWFFTCSTIKTVDDHCGYAFPWDPLQRMTSNNAAYHDIHHQSWGIKTNFSQPFFTSWDRWLGTKWAGGDVSARYERSRLGVPKKAGDDASVMSSTVTQLPAVDRETAIQQAAASQRQVLDDNENGGAQILREEQAEEQEVIRKVTRSSRRKTGSIDPKGDSLRGLRDRMAGSLHGRRTAILHADGRH